MTFKLVKETEPDGSIWYKIYVDNAIKAAKRDEQEMRQLYLLMVENAKNGIVGEETLEEITITPKP